MVAKPPESPYQPGKRTMIKVKHVRTADCVVAGFRWHKSGKDAVGSLLLGLYDDAGVLQHVGVTSSFTMAKRKQLVKELAPLRRTRSRGIPGARWAEADASAMSRMPGGQSRWSAGKDLSWEPLRVERVCEVKYDHLQGDRFRHAAVFLRWRPDKRPSDCRYDQLEVTPPYELAQGLFVRIQRLLSRPELGRHVPQVHPDAGPRGEAAPHGVHQHVRRLQMGRRLGVARLPALQPRQHILLPLPAADLDQRMLRGPRLGRLHPLGLARLLLVVRRPRGVAQALAPRAAPTARAAIRASRRDRRCPRADRRPPRTAPAWSPE